MRFLGPYPFKSPQSSVALMQISGALDYMREMLFGVKVKHSFRTRRLLDILRIYEAAEGLLLLANSPPLVVAGNEKPCSSVPSTVVGSDFDVYRSKDVVDERVDALSADDLMARFLMIGKVDASWCIIAGKVAVLVGYRLLMSSLLLIIAIRLCF
ncbi:hypothetical protein Hanom_Chr12g01142401 [Helianthus anomalus]